MSTDTATASTEAETPAVPLQRRAGRARSSAAGRTAGRARARSTCPTRRAVGDGRDAARARRSTCSTCSRTRPASGLHVGHPLGFIGTDVLGRYLRMTGSTVLHAMGFDAFGLPAEQYAVQTGTHPRKTTEENIQRYQAQLRQLGLAHDERRSVATTDVEFYRWTQWIFLQIYNSWYDETQRRPARSPSWRPSSPPGSADARRAAVGRADAAPSSAG